MFFPQDAVQLHYPVLETGFTASEIQELLSLFESPTRSPDSGLEGSNSNSNSNSNRVVYSVDERKRRRMISNRESARRSRWRKKQHLENLEVEVNRLKIQNQELKKLLGSVLGQCHVLWRENDQLTTEYLGLQARLSDLRHALVAMHSK
ncbi:hypothetical protein P3X46_021135 [Hevea brasiliensis]|uniref:BZIP domain-containing protein n=1 Tax=Hevea brasiliensis TaxID=3981 RepID=A0ABQ9LFN5_HEVBR|nr:basic leucine zipper 4 [Hevea brasiliensis]KAJ9166365.1 hypothetical protein P3X46_021135 [Hevea brasiliensis]